MIRSMTGFGSASTEVDGVQYAVELRSVNNKFFKATIRIPESLQSLESELESMLSKRFSRGSITLLVEFADKAGSITGRINEPVVNSYIDQLRKVVADRAGQDPGSDESLVLDVTRILELPGSLVTELDDSIIDKARGVFTDLVGQAADKLESMREREGRDLHELLGDFGDSIGGRLAVIAERAPSVVEQYQGRLQSRINELLSELGGTVSEADLIREVAIFAERSDIAEEISRLQGHLNQFKEIIDSDNGQPSGRTLDFLSQEMLREANTIASKSADVEISREIVEIKGSIDRIKEQAQNVE